MPNLSRIRVHPVKALDAVDLDAVEISSAGGLAGDRAFAIVDGDGEYVNGKRTDAVHRLDAEVDLGAGTIRLGVRESADREAFDLGGDRPPLEDWLSSYLGYGVELEAGRGGELTDSSVLGGDPPGVTVVSTATLRTVASWFPEIDVDGVRRRFRANLEVDGVDPFWEDRLVGAEGARIQLGGATLRVVEPVPRCVVPTRHPDTGEPTDGFRERFLRRREETFPDGVNRDAFDHLYSLTVLAEPTEASRGERLTVGDRVEVLADAVA